jgi:hypothetical protein
MHMNIIQMAANRIPATETKIPFDRTLGHDELELKIDLSPGEEGLQQVGNILALSSVAPILRGQQRKEMHVVLHRSGAPDHREIIYRYDNKQPHLKHKQRGTVVNTPGGVPLLLRDERHHKPHGRDADRWDFYRGLAVVQANDPCVGTFFKDSVDLEMCAGNAMLALSVSTVVDARDNEMLAQAEIEYAGHRQNTRPPTMEDIYRVFDELADRLDPALRGHFSTRSKLTWLLDKKTADIAS